MTEASTPEIGVLPPVGNTGVEPVPELSWVAGSVRSHHPPVDGSRLWDTLLRPWASDWIQSGARHYGKGFRSADWSAGVYWDGQGDAKGTVWLEARQSALDRMPAQHRLDLLRAIRPGRLDIARDDPYQRVRPRDLFHGARDARSRTHKSRWRLEMTDFGERTTLYVGSRSSDRMLRVYDKPGYGVRHELELKRDAAHDAAALLTAGWGVDAVYWAEYDRVATWPALDGWQALRPS